VIDFSLCNISGTLCQNGNRNVSVWGKADIFNVLHKPDQSVEAVHWNAWRV